ncbi:hypothetical protein K523DRAFT_244813, partial [Schizophyllum commune Tattone D]
YAKAFLPEITLLVELCTQSPIQIWTTWVGSHSCLDTISALRLLWRPTRDTANSVAVYAMHVSQIFEGLRGVVDAIFLAISSDHGVACEPQVAGIVDASSILLARNDDGLHAFDVADGNIFKYVQIVNKQFSPSRLTKFCLPLIDLRTYQDMLRKRARPGIMRELRGLHTHMVFVSSVLEQIRISVSFMTDRFSGDKLANLRRLPEGEQRRLSEGMRQITRWLAREADSWREVVQDIGYQEEGYWRRLQSRIKPASEIEEDRLFS